MTDDKIIRFPAKTAKRIRNRRGQHSVSCNVSDRWLSISKTARKIDFGSGLAGTAVFINVMTDASGVSRKMCELCITLEDLAKALQAVKVVDGKR